MSAPTTGKRVYDKASLSVFEMAEGLAELTGFQVLYPAHLFLALASDDAGYLDGLLREKFQNLSAATVADSLREILEMEAPGTDPAVQGSGDPASIGCTARATASLARAAELAEAWGKQEITPEALTVALLEAPENSVLEAFRDAGIEPPMIRQVAEALVGTPRVLRLAPVVIADGYLRMESFGTMARQAIRVLTQLGAGRDLLAEDLFIALLSLEESRTVQALHVMGLHPDAMLRTLIQRYGKPQGGLGLRLEEGRLGRMLRGIIENSARIALRENCDLVSECHLMRAHLERIANSDTHLFQRLGINIERLRVYLEGYKVDREPKETEEQSRMIQDIDGYLMSRVVAQEEAIRKVVPALRRMRTGMNQPGRLMGVFLFLGATGVGKTELAKAIADVAFPPKPGVRDPYLIRVDCGFLEGENAIVRLIGAAQGFVGYKEGALTNGLRDKGLNCVILFDEAEKAHPKVWQSLLSFFGEGIVTEADGTLYDATGCILIATSNLGFKAAVERFRLFDLTAQQLAEISPKMQDFVWTHVVDYFSPEFRGRFGRENVLFFNHFRREHYRQMIDAQLAALEGEMRAREIVIEIDQTLPGMLTELAWDGRENGARDVQRLITTYARDQISDAITGDPKRRLIPVTVSPELRAVMEARAEKQVKKQAPTVNVEAYLRQRVVNQDHAVSAVVPALKRMKAGLNEPGRLMGVFLFLGATGVGKTELARAIADVAFGLKEGERDAHLILINCGVLKEPRDIVQVLGAPQGLVGYKEGTLTNGLREKANRCVILFDEAEKAHPQIWQSLLQLFDEGIVLEADGTRHDATGCILVATSNLGYRDAMEKFRIFDRPVHELAQLQPKVEAFVWKNVTEYFSPEFRGRFGRENVIFFNHFTQPAYRAMLEQQGATLAAEMTKRGIAVTVAPEAYAGLTLLAWDKRNEGARPVRRLITAHIRDVVVEARADNPDCGAVHVTVSGRLETELRALEARSREETVDDIATYLNARVINQTNAIKAVVPAVKRMRASMNEPGRLLGSFLFLGPSGVGKTELAKCIADVAFGPKPGVKDPYMIRVDCGKLGDRRDIVQLLGAPQGLVGYKEGTLTNGLRDKGGRCIVLFDEAEKADPHIWQSLLTFFDEGIVTEADGTRYDATGCILIATSNLGYKKAIQTFKLFDIRPEDLDNIRPQVDEFIWNEIRGYFSPEFLGRFGRENVILFNHFDKPSYREILSVQVGQLVREQSARGFNVTVSPEVIDTLRDLAWEKRDEGARTVRRLITSNIRDLIVDGVSEDPARTEFAFVVRDGRIAADYGAGHGGL